MDENYIKAYFEDNGLYDYTDEEKYEFINRRSKFAKKQMTLANVNNHDAARHFFNQYDIPFREITRGENKGKLAVLPIRQSDYHILREARGAFISAGYDWAVDHANCFRDDRDRTVVTFSPYHDVRCFYGIRLGRFGVTVSEFSIYGLMTETVVARVHAIW